MADKGNLNEPVMLITCLVCGNQLKLYGGSRKRHKELIESFVNIHRNCKKDEIRLPRE
jgi:hypothetical protein